ncbi:DUF1990 family protein [Agromyces soli]|uniref:DUF1990 domain-containing protein n=1 Tax=Agromyces soli TaxID=659012 RepID=A0ABY4AQW6_9MICO|nr:DUF1990 domain-containing protein [Agromyces soli]UOE25508.1 DUF1990 domain-containing protein [Agromyces soli]
MRPDDDPPPSLLNDLTARAGFDSSEVSRTIGDGDALWHRAAVDLLRWRVKTRSGFRVPGGAVATPGARLVIRAGLLRWSVDEPVEVIAVVDEPDRVGFAYVTRPGHPLEGEEAFVLDRTADGAITLTVRSRSRAAPQGTWRRAYPLLRIAQRVTRWRYLRALR